LKDHPLGRPYRDYSALLDELRNAHGLGDRLCYVDVIHLPSALRNARGVVTINSTVGLSSIHHGTPVKCLGTAVYDMPGLTYGGPLDEFWRAPGEVDADLYRKFRWWLRTNNQINGSVWRELWP
jgi:capsule polysaccharide modification protein KpsS